MGRTSIHQAIRRVFHFPEDTPDRILVKMIGEMKKKHCKPCWEIKYCPYGPFVEESPLLPPLRGEVEEQHDSYRSLLNSDKTSNGSPLDDKKREIIEGLIADYCPEDFPDIVPEVIEEMQCKIFGHICPVYFYAEDFTETDKGRRTGRSILQGIMLRVARRDNYTCQICGKHLLDHEIEFDHIIPLSKGGSSEENNIQVACQSCNRRKSNQLK